MYKHLHSDSIVPTSFHKAIDKLAGEGRLLGHITQNFDCIQQSDLKVKTIRLYDKLTKRDARNATGPVNSNCVCFHVLIYHTVRDA